MTINRQVSDRVLDLHDAYRYFGYVLTAEPIDGMEDLFVETNRAVIQGLDDTLSVINRSYRTRGRSKRALAILHSRKPHPAWGVEVANV